MEATISSGSIGKTSSAISPEIEDDVLARLAAVLDKCKVLAISDYAKGNLTPRVLRQAIDLARSKNVPVIVDPKRRDISAYAGATLIKPNRAELSAATGIPCGTDDELEHAAQAVIEATGASLIVTRSERGMSYFARGQEPIHMATHARLIFDVSGAGDTVLATCACGLAAGLPIEQTMRLANLAAGIVVSKPGTATVTFDELRTEASAHDAPSAFRKGGLTSQTQAKAIREYWRLQGLSVGFTNGCFDLLHPGHVSSLRGAARNCDRLIVGLNADESVSRLKGPTRPVQNEAARAEVLGAMDCVDLVVIFSSDTPFELISDLKPDVLIKGADYGGEEIVGSDVVLAAGGRVERISIVEGHSTSDIIRRTRTESR